MLSTVERLYIGKNMYLIIWNRRKSKNHGEIENIVAEGTHIPIVTKEEYARVKKKMDAKNTICR